MILKEWLNMPETRYGTMRIIRWLWLACRGNRIQAALNASIGLFQVGVGLAQVWAVKHAIDVASGVAGGSVYAAVGLIGALLLSDFLLMMGSVWVRSIFGVKARNRMQQQMLDRLLRSEWTGRQQRHSGDIINRLQYDVGEVIGFLTETIPNALSVTAMFVGAFVCLFSMDRLLALVTVFILPVFMAVSKVYVRHMRRITRQVRDTDSRIQSILQETIQHSILLKTLECCPRMLAKLKRSHVELRRNVIRRTSYSVFSNFVLSLGFASGYLVAFLWAALRMSGGSLSFGGMTAFLQLVNKIQSPAHSLMKLIPAFVGVLTAAERLMELEESPLEEQGSPTVYDHPCGVRLVGVTYSYSPDRHEVIDNLDFDFAPGTCTAVLGETGAGKTTLIRLVLALIRPQSGRVEIYDEIGCREVSPPLRCNMTYVPQGNTLMSGTIRDNLLLGNPDATDTQLFEALRKCCAGFVADLPHGLDTLCAEQGGGLSEGQAQRIAIARALLRDRPVMLLDEATSALDPDTECRLLQNLLSDRSKTVICVTHRPAVADRCDLTLRMKRYV